MIIRRDGSDLLLIHQADHSALAGRIMAAWKADGFADRPTRDRVLAATARHDLGWEPDDTQPRIDPVTELPYDFVSAPIEVRQGAWPRALDTLAPEDPYVAALVAQHAITVYRRFANDEAWLDFFTVMTQRRDDLFAKSDTGNGLDSFLQDYTMVGLGDLFSLVFCNAWPEPYLMEGYQAILHGDRLQIAPDPFDGASVPLEIDARRIPARPYASDADLRAVVAEAPIVRLAGTASGTPLPATT